MRRRCRPLCIRPLLCCAAEWFATAAHAKEREVREEQSSAAVRTASDGVGRVQSDELRFDAAAKAFHFDCDDTGECGQPSC